MKGSGLISDSTTSRFKEKLQLDYMDYLMPYGLAQYSKRENMSHEDIATLDKTEQIMSLVNEVHESLSKGNLDSEQIKFLNRFLRPLSAAIEAFLNLQHILEGKKPDMAQVMEYMRNSPEFLKSQKLEPTAKSYTAQKSGELRKATLKEKLDTAKDKAKEADSKTEARGDKPRKRDERS